MDGIIVGKVKFTDKCMIVAKSAVIKAFLEHRTVIAGAPTKNLTLRRFLA